MISRSRLSNNVQVTHDGVFSTLNQITSDELYFPEHDVSFARSGTFPPSWC